MIGVIARSRWGWWSWLTRSVDRSTQSLRHSLPLSRDRRSPCRHEASVLGAAPGAPANLQYPFGGTRHPALMHLAVQAAGAREWRKAGALCAPNPLGKITGGSSRVPSRLWWRSTQWHSTHRYCARPRWPARPSRTADIRPCTSVTVVCRRRRCCIYGPFRRAHYRRA
jgi:hypothetical protein